MKKLGPQRKAAIERARGQAKQRKQKADEALRTCAAAAKKKGIMEKVAICRSGAQTKDDFTACDAK